MKKIIMIDAGHGGRDSGAVGNGRKEKEDVLKLALLTAEILRKKGMQAELTRRTDFYESPFQKAEKGNSAGADLFVSIHRNSAESPDACGFETLVYENAGKAKKAADYANTKMSELGYQNRGTKIRKDLIVLNSTKMEAVLFEAGFISNKDDNEVFDKNLQRQAEILADAALAAFDMYGDEGEVPPVIQMEQEKKFIDVAYQVYTDHWLPVVHSMNDFAGIENERIKGIRVWTVGAQSEVGNVKYRVHLKRFSADEWLEWVIDRQRDKYGDDFAGNLKDEIDAIQMQLLNCPGRAVEYRVKGISEINYYPFVKNTENEGGYAGVYGTAIDKLQCRIQ